MPTSYTNARQSLRSGDVLAFRGTGPLNQDIDDHPTGLYSHVALVWVVGKRIFLLETIQNQGVVISAASNRVAGIHCDVIRTKTNWTDSLEAIALEVASSGQNSLIAFLKAMGVNPAKGEISSLFVGTVLSASGILLGMKGLYTQVLVDDLLELGYQIQRLVSSDLDNSGGIASVTFLDSKGNPMSSVTLPRDEQATVDLVFKSATGLVLKAPADLTAVSSDPTIVSVTLAAGVLTLLPVADGTANIDVSSAAFASPAVLPVTVEDPPISSVEFGTPTFSAIPAPASAPAVVEPAPAAVEPAPAAVEPAPAQ